MRSRRVLVAMLLCAIAVASWSPARSDQTAAELEQLFERLQSTRSSREARAVEQRIWALWLESGVEEVDRLMAGGLRATDAMEYEAAVQIFDEVVRRLPDFAEGWNRRATVLYLLGDYRRALEDIGRTLDLEPRHFGALAGRGLIRLRQANRYAALLDFEAALRLNPRSAGLRRSVLALRQQLGSETV